MRQKVVVTEENCSRCNGVGKISNWHYSFGGRYWDEKPKQVTCTECDGRRKVTVSTTYTDYTQ